MMKLMESAFVIAMLIPFAVQTEWTYYYWIAVTTAYLAYIAVRRWEYE